MEVVGVMHRRGPAFGALEGESAGEEGDDGIGDRGFRDCAGIALRDPAVRTFSAHGGKPATWQHELGHASFGLGDEYWESETTRRVSPLLTGVLDRDLSCCCIQTGDPLIDSGDSEGEGGFGVAGGSAAGIYCIEGAGEEPRFFCGVQPPDSNLPVANPCSPADEAAVPSGCGEDIPPQCGESPIEEAACPPLRGDCVLPSAWLAGTPSDPFASQRPNVFVSLEECHASVSAAADHPGVEVGDTGIGKCVELCGMEGNPCPCGDRELWIADVNPIDESIDDLMATNQASLNLYGGTCDWCIETSLCIRWQRALGQSEEDAWTWCQTPPEEAP